jgi:hypothetical protein
MNLRNFIKETLIQIAQGIEDASHALDSTTAIVNPRNVTGTTGAVDSKVYGYIADDISPRQVVQRINFDVAISVAQGTETKGGIGLVVGAVALGSQGKSDSSNTSQSRIQFTIPMVLPTKHGRLG